MTSRTQREIEAWLAQQIAGILGIDPDEVGTHDTFDSFGLASRDAVSLSGDLEDWLGQRLSPTILYQHPTISELAEHLAASGQPAQTIAPGDQETASLAERMPPVERPPEPVQSDAQASEPEDPASQGGWEESGATEVPALNGREAIVGEPIAIVGMACRFPGADNTDELWRLLRDGVDAISETPGERWDNDALYDRVTGTPGKMNTRWGGYLRDIAHFDAHFFGIAPREAAAMDPQQRLLLETAWEALEDAGIPAEQLAGTATGVFIGVSANDYSHLQFGDPLHITPYIGTGNAFSICANRISYLFDLRGPSLAVDTACSSSLVAVHLACASLRSGESETALAGGVNVLLSPETTVTFSQAHMMAADGRCKTFDARADGYVRGEGVGVVVLKRLADARRDGDRVLAVIRSSAVNQDGRSNGLTAPNPHAQEAVIRAALDAAQLAPDAVSYIEAHGTGTALGDPIEMRALGAVFGAPAGDGPRAGETPRIAIGSLKTNIGHLESAAGIASLIKVVLMLQHRQIPPSLHFESPNPYIPFEQLPLRVQTALGPWSPAAGAGLVAGISSFGFGGTNAHLVVTEPPVPVATRRAPDATGAQKDRPFFLALSARTPQALLAQAQAYHDFLLSTDAALDDIAFSAMVRRSHLEHRLGVIGTSKQEIAERLDAFMRGETGPGCATGCAGSRPTAGQDCGGRVALVFSGQGSQWPGMGRELLATEPVFRQAVEAVDAELAQYTGWSVIDELTADARHARLDETAVAQPAIFAIQVGLAALLQSWGILPDALVGHSVGEIAAAYVGGVLDLADAVRVVYHRSRLMQAATGLGKMAAAAITATEALELLEGYEGRLSLAAINSPHSVTFSGEADALAEVLAKVQARGLFYRMLPVNYAFHSPQMEPFLEELVAALAGIRTRPATIPVFSTVTGQAAGAEDYSADYWRRNVRQTVRFSDAIAALRTANCDTFVEVGPHPVLVRNLNECLADEQSAADDVAVLSSLRRDRPERIALLEAVSALYCRGWVPRWLGARSGGKPVRLPSYRWQRQPYWSETAGRVHGLALKPLPLGQAAGAGGGRNVRLRDVQAIHPLLGVPLRSPALRDTVLDNLIPSNETAYLYDHRIAGTPLLPATAYLEMALAAAGLAFEVPPNGLALRDVSLLEAMPLPETGNAERRVQVIVTKDDGAGSGRFQVYSMLEEANPRASCPPWTLHASGGIERREPPAPAAPLAIEEIESRCTPGPSPVQFYRDLEAHGLEYGRAFQGVTALWKATGENGREALGRLQLPDDVPDEGYVLHPALLDAGFHVLAAALSDERPAGEDDAVYLPVGVEQLKVWSGIGREAWAHVTLRDPADSTRAEDALIGDLSLYGPQGLAAAVTGLRVQRVPRALLALMLNRAARTSAEPEPVTGWLYETIWRRAEAAVGSEQPDGETWAQGTWLILTRNAGQGAGHALGEALAAAGGSPWYILPAKTRTRLAADTFTADPFAGGDLLEIVQQALATGRPLRGAVHLLAAEGDTATGAGWLAGMTANEEAALGMALHLTQALARETSASEQPARLWLVTRGARAVLPDESSAPGQNPLWGLRNVIALEHPELRPVGVDLEPGNDDVDGLLALLRGAAGAESGREDRLALRGGVCYMERLARYRPPVVVGPAAESTTAEETFLRLEITERGMLDNIVAVPVRRVPPGPGQVEIAVAAAGLNFRDVMNALGLYPGDAGMLGSECAGMIAAVGPGVTGLAVGQPIIAIAPGSFGAYATTLAELVAPKPAALSYEEAATIPIAFLTAHYALDRIGGMKAGERVLVHAATGGVGLAAIQLARRAGAEVFGTAGSPVKREFLAQQGVARVMNSRTLSFSDETLAATGGRGVELVLNSLSGDFIPKSLATLAADGRFLEIGKVGTWTSEQVARVRPGATYATIALDDLSARQPALIRELLAELLVEFEAGRLQPLRFTAYPVEQATDAFRLMAQTRHIGKIVITQPGFAERAALASGQRAVEAIYPGAAYLITGGLGALGTQVAGWLVEQGARNLVLAGIAPPSAAACAAIAEMEGRGARIQVVTVDVTREEEAARLFAQAAADGLRLRGIIHAAGLLDDGLLLQQTWDRFVRVMAPKVAGAWHLYRLAQNLDLDFFVSFSSVASVFGSPGQANYAAANAYLDGLANLSEARGFRPLTVNWGPWAGGGMAAGDAHGRARREASGIDALPPERGLEILGLLLGVQGTPGATGEVIAAPLQWRTLAGRFAAGEEPRLLADLLAAEGSRAEEAETGPHAEPASAPGGQPQLMARLEAAAPRDRVPLLIDFLRERTLKVLALEPSYPLDVRKPLNEMGLDSLMAVELKNGLDAAIGRKLPPTLVFEYPTIEGLARHVVGTVLGLDTVAARSTTESASPAASVPEAARAEDEELSAALTEMSDEEAESLLLQRLDELDG